MKNINNEISVRSVEDAPQGARRDLEEVAAGLGFVPNLMGVMANAPSLLQSYRAVSGFFDSSSLNPTERQIVLLTTSFQNGCDYCMAAHTVIADMQKVDRAVIDALRSGRPIMDDKLEALRVLTMELVEKRGWPSEEALRRFLNVGYSSSQLLEVVLGIGLKILSNYTNHLAATPLDSAFEKAKWTSTQK